jgi:hypothetical protein
VQHGNLVAATEPHAPEQRRQHFLEERIIVDSHENLHDCDLPAETGHVSKSNS